MTMKLFPFHKIAEAASQAIHAGAVVFQQFLCEACGVKQTIGEENQLFTSGKCEECGHVTDLVKNGCNILAIIGGAGGEKGSVH